MNSLNSRLQLAVLNRKKSRNLVEKGFTLVELMIVIVIVGVLSSVALPNFLNQTNRARATECVALGGKLLNDINTESHRLGVSTDLVEDALTATAGAITEANDASENCVFAAGSVTGTTATLDVTGAEALAGSSWNGCIDPGTGKKDFVEITESVDAANCA
jgi:type IV pilus assembly protein PilA